MRCRVAMCVFRCSICVCVCVCVCVCKETCPSREEISRSFCYWFWVEAGWCAHMHVTHEHTTCVPRVPPETTCNRPYPFQALQSKGTFRTPVPRAEGCTGPPFYRGRGWEAGCNAWRPELSGEHEHRPGHDLGGGGMREG